jgi:hypothetical protein
VTPPRQGESLPRGPTFSFPPHRVQPASRIATHPISSGPGHPKPKSPIHLVASGDCVLAHGLFQRQRRRSALPGKLQPGNPHVGVDDEDHSLTRSLRRLGFLERTSLISRETSASV